jgi:DUF438 domain-containing protein
MAEEEEAQEQVEETPETSDDLLKKIEGVIDEKLKSTFGKLLDSGEIDVEDRADVDEDKIRQMVRRAIEELKLAEADQKVKAEVKEVVEKVEEKVKKVPFLQRIFWGEL